MKLFSFEIGGELLGLEARYVYRVIEDIQVAPVCFTPSVYMGLIYYRGELFDVIDLDCLLEKNGPDTVGKNRVVIVRWANQKIAIAVRHIVGLLWIQGGCDGDTCYTEDERPIRILTPGQIWEKLTTQPYGPVQV